MLRLERRAAIVVVCLLLIAAAPPTTAPIPADIQAMGNAIEKDMARGDGSVLDS